MTQNAGFMSPFEVLVSRAARLPMADIDTDRILPARRMRGLTRDGLGVFLFERMRYDETMAEQPGFVLNRPEFRDARILVAGANFGCGSSREHAVWSLRDYGIRCIIAPSFGDIFTNNCRENGLLLISLPGAEHDRLNAHLDHAPTAPLTVDLRAQRIGLSGGAAIDFAIDASVQRHLLDGRDSIARTLALEGAISNYERRAAGW